MMGRMSHAAAAITVVAGAVVACSQEFFVSVGRLFIFEGISIRSLDTLVCFV